MIFHHTLPTSGLNPVYGINRFAAVVLASQSACVSCTLSLPCFVQVPHHILTALLEKSRYSTRRHNDSSPRAQLKSLSLSCPGKTSMRPGIDLSLPLKRPPPIFHTDRENKVLSSQRPRSSSSPSYTHDTKDLLPSFWSVDLLRIGSTVEEEHFIRREYSSRRTDYGLKTREGRLHPSRVSLVGPSLSQEK